MIQVKFKNFKKSEMVQQNVQDRLGSLVLKFPDLIQSKMLVTIEMENSPLQAGPDLFKVRLYIARGRYNGVQVEKENANVYVALAEVADHMLEALNRFGDKARVKERKKARQIIDEAQINSSQEI